jgi:hypothetical protein
LKYQATWAVIENMANGKIKTEMTGTGGGRWCPRAVAKQVSKKTRRRNAKREIREQLK